MSEAEDQERLRYLRLKAKAAQAAQPAAAAPSPSQPDQGPGKGEALARGFLQGGTFGWGEELGGLVGAPILKALTSRIYGNGVQLTPQAQAEAQRLSIDVPKPLEAPTLGQAYRTVRDDIRSADDAASNAHGGYYLGGQVLGGIATGKALPSIQLAKGAPLTYRAIAGLASAIPAGGLYGAGASRADLTQPSFANVSQFAGDTAMGASLAGVLGLGLPIAGAIPGALKDRLVRGVVKPTEAADMLRKLGVNLTVGQMNPQGGLAGMEEAAQSVGGVGKVIEAQRAAGREGWQQAVLPGSGSIQERLADQRKAFGPAYEAIGAHPAQPVVSQGGKLVPLADAFDRAAEDPNVLANDTQVGAVKRFLKNQASLFTRQAETPAAQQGSLKADSLLKVRENIRKAIRVAKQSEDFTSAGLLGNAEDVVTKSLEGQLPRDALEALQATDAAYAQHRAVSDAVARAGDAPGGFTPAQLAAAVKKATERRGYEVGAGGQLRDLARAGREALDTRVTPNGGRALAFLPGAKHVTATLSALANTAPMKSALLGETTLQQLLQKAAARQPGPFLEALSGTGTGAVMAPAELSLVPAPWAPWAQPAMAQQQGPRNAPWAGALAQGGH